MKLNCEIDFVIGDQKCVFRTLSPDDVTDLYVSSLKVEREFISNVPRELDDQKQREYIRNIVRSADDTICGLFVDGILVGTAGIQNLFGEKSIEVVDGVSFNCTVGIFVFSKSSRGKGYGKTLVWAACTLANQSVRIEKFEACMQKVNLPSLKSFIACGFIVVKENSTSYQVSLESQRLLQPAIIAGVNIY